MKKNILIIAALLIFPMSIFGAKARIIAVRGTVSVRRYAGASWVRARRNMYVGRGATISTGYGASVLLRIYPSGSVIRLNQFTTASISRLASRGTAKRRTVATSLRLRYGTVRAVVKSSLKLRSRFRISTPVATASVRGTIPQVSHFPGQGTTISYIKGSGFVISRRGRVQLLARRQLSRISTRGRSTTPFEEIAKRRAVGSSRINLTPAERRVIMRGVTGRLPGHGAILPHAIWMLQQHIRITKLAGFKPIKL